MNIDISHHRLDVGPLEGELWWLCRKRNEIMDSSWAVEGDDWNAPTCVYNPGDDRDLRKDHGNCGYVWVIDEEEIYL